MTLQQLKYVIEVAGCGSINEASKRLFVSQPSLSAAIRELENELGFQIFLRSNRGIELSQDGAEFLGYARQVVEQSSLLEQRYFKAAPARQRFSVSTQHYAFAVNAFVDLVKQHGSDEYEFSLKETRTYDVIDDVKALRSEIGIIYLNSFNGKVLNKLMQENNLAFHPLLEAKPHIFVCKNSPLSARKSVELPELEPYPCLSFDQGQYNSFYFSEEILSTVEHKKQIRVSDRATLFNLLIGLNGYTISTGVISSDLNHPDIIAVPLKVDQTILVGWIAHKNVSLSRLAEIYISALEKSVGSKKDA